MISKKSYVHIIFLDLKIGLNYFIIQELSTEFLYMQILLAVHKYKIYSKYFVTRAEFTLLLNENQHFL